MNFLSLTRERERELIRDVDVTWMERVSCVKAVTLTLPTFSGLNKFKRERERKKNIKKNIAAIT